MFNAWHYHGEDRIHLEQALWWHDHYFSCAPISDHHISNPFNSKIEVFNTTIPVVHDLVSSQINLNHSGNHYEGRPYRGKHSLLRIFCSHCFPDMPLCFFPMPGMLINLVIASGNSYGVGLQRYPVSPSLKLLLKSPNRTTTCHLP